MSQHAQLGTTARTSKQVRALVQHSMCSGSSSGVGTWLRDRLVRVRRFKEGIWYLKQAVATQEKVLEGHSEALLGRHSEELASSYGELGKAELQQALRLSGNTPWPAAVGQPALHNQGRPVLTRCCPLPQLALMEQAMEHVQSSATIRCHFDNTSALVTCLSTFGALVPVRLSRPA